uniref:Secreted protein n=1 Tax=Terrapene triunguis TaxID=2587831 RepID=A0A674J9P3_9SAUR
MKSFSSLLWLLNVAHHLKGSDLSGPMGNITSCCYNSRHQHRPLSEYKLVFKWIILYIFSTKKFWSRSCPRKSLT